MYVRASNLSLKCEVKEMNGIWAYSTAQGIRPEYPARGFACKSFFRDSHDISLMWAVVPRPVEAFLGSVADV